MLAAIILAGGHSQRMGQDKSLLMRPDGRLQWQFVADCLRELGIARLFLSLAADSSLGSEYSFADDIQIIHDHIKNAGPLAGIDSAFSQLAEDDQLVIVPCDLPWLCVEALRPLLESSAPHVTFAEQVLPCRVTSTTEARRYLQQVLASPCENRSVRGFLQEIGAQPLHSDFSQQLRSANTPREWQTFINQQSASISHFKSKSDKNTIGAKANG